MKTAGLLILFWSAATLGCIGELEPSSGRCVGSVEGTQVDDPLYPEESYFYRDDQQNMVEHAFIDMTFGENASSGDRVLQIKAHVTDMPSEQYEGEHELPSSGSSESYVDGWNLTIPDTSYRSGSLTIDEASNTVIEGSFDMTFNDDTKVECNVKLTRNYSMDTDD